MPRWKCGRLELSIGIAVALSVSSRRGISSVLSIVDRFHHSSPDFVLIAGILSADQLFGASLEE